MTPYRITWRNHNITGKVTTYADSLEEAERNFLKWHPIGVILGVTVKEIEIDVEQAEKDIALLVAYRARQLWGCSPQAVHHVRKTLAAGLIPLCNVSDELVRRKLPV